MDNELKSILKKILTIAEYQGNKEEYAEKFLHNCHIEALAIIIESLPEEKQTQVTDKLNTLASDNISEDIAKYFPPDEYRNAFNESYKKAFDEYLGEIIPELSEDQNKELSSLFQTMQSSASEA